MTAGVRAGNPHRLGVHWDGEGVYVAVFARDATAVELCLFDDSGNETRLALPFVQHGIWHAYVAGISPGQRYGFRAHGPYEPERGLRFNPNKLLIDPYARAISGRLDYTAPILGYDRCSHEADLSFDEHDSAAGVPMAVVVDTSFDWQGDRRLQIPWRDTVIYEVHVKGFTALHPDIPEDIRGTYAGFAHPAALRHLTDLGVTAVELLPIHEFVDEPHLHELGLTNYWGYNSIGFFAPTARYAASDDRGGQVREFKELVRSLHAAGLEVILDVVYNHTGEGNELGPTLSLRGLDNRAYYRLVEGDERACVDFTGTGNSLNTEEAITLRLIADSLRYWVDEYHIDGFRFDLATALAREPMEFTSRAAFLDILQQDPLLATVKLIAEPWDVGVGGYQVGGFPPPWAEWNAAYRDTLRRFWRGNDHSIDDLANRITGSSDIYAASGRGPHASVNFVTAHDGFTLADLVSYERKHNEANGEENRDGQNENYSSNHGTEGPTDDPVILEARIKKQRSLLASLFFSQGVPMLLGGDEIGRTQMGNNNAYCQDNELSWLNWQLDEHATGLLTFTRHVIALRHKHPALRRGDFFKGVPQNGSDRKDVTWLRPDGAEMTPEDWSTSWVRSLGLLIDGNGVTDLDENGNPLHDQSLLLLINGFDGPVEFVTPAIDHSLWAVVVDTARFGTDGACVEVRGGARLTLEGFSLALLEAHPAED
ncbi:MAG: glycogen debranching enzyme GlgX [Chloroflexi bacterium]|nr:MAG: glycogen debranching enzyme GlgX [Chloroflexota bacterium]